MKLFLQKNLAQLCLVLLLFVPFFRVTAQTPVPMASQPGNTYTENFADIANWTANFASGIGANRWASYPITTGGTANDGKRTTKSSAVFSTTTSGGVQRGTQNLVFLSTGSGTPSEAVAVDLLLDFTGTNAGTLSFNWAAVDNGNGTRPTSLRIFWSVDNTTFTEITAAQILDVQSVNSGAITNVALPSAFNNTATARLRFYNHAGTVTGAGNRDKISVDDITVTATPMASPLILATGSPLTSMNTTYGTASGNTSFTVSGSLLNTGITITPPLGFEVAISNNFSTTIGTNVSPLVIGAAGTVPNTDVYVRLAANAAAGNYTGNIVLSSTGASVVNVATNATNTVAPKGLTITGVTANDKNFDNTTTATLSGTPLLSGVVAGDEPNVAINASAVTANFADPAVGNNKPVTVSGYTLTGSSAANYSLSQPTGLTANILPSGLSDQTITFGPLSAVTYGVAPFNLTATSDSGLTVTYISSNNAIASVSGNTVTVHRAGTVTITAQQSGNSSYNAATDVSQSLLINPKPVTISGAAAQSKTYDGNTNAVITGTLSGVIAPDSVTLNLSGSFNDAAVGNNKPVTSTSTITGADASNYALTQPSGLTANITPAVCSIASTNTVTWNFATAAPSANASPAVTVSNIAYGNNNGTTTPLISTTSPSNYTGASGTQNAGAAVLTGALDTAVSTYFEFTLIPVAGYNFTLTGFSFGSRSTSTGPQAYVLRSDVDGYTANIAAGTMGNNGVWVLNTPTVTALSSTNAPIVFRLYGYAGTGNAALNTANWRIDDLVLTLAATPTAALSSPAAASTCSGQTFSYSPTTNYTGATITWTRAAVAGISNAAVTTPQTSGPNEILVNTTNAPVDVVYAFTVTTSTCTISQNVTVTVNNCVSSSMVNLKLFIQGYYLGGGAMNTVADNQAAIFPAVSNDVEQITVELHEAAAPYAVVATTTAMLHTDGTASCEFSTGPNGSYYIAVKTRNAVQTWSALPQTIGNIPLSYDFTTAAGQAYGDNQFDLGDGSFAFYSGDIAVLGIQDDAVDGADYTTWEADNNDFAFGAFATDLNGDGAVDGADYSIWETSNNNFVFAIYPVN